MKVAAQLCDASVSDDVLKLFPEKYANEAILDIINGIENSLEYTAVSCRFLNQTINCSDLLSPITSEDGYCLSFNTMNMFDYGTNE